MTWIKGMGNDTLFIRIFAFISGLYPLALGGIIFTMAIMKPDGGFWAIVSILFTVLFVYMGIKLLILSFARASAIEEKLNKWLDVGGLDIFGFILFVGLMVLAGIFAWILTVIIRVFIPQKKYTVKLQKLNKL